MNEEKEIWLTSSSEELFTGSDEFATKEEAIEAGKDDYDGSSFYVGKQAQIDIPGLVSGIADNIEEQLAEWVWDQVGEACDGSNWPTFSAEDKQRIEKLLIEILESDPPSFYKVTNVEGIRAETLEESLVRDAKEDPTP